MRFEHFYGNEEVKRRLSSMADGGRLPHALLMEGPQGSGRRTLARLIAQAAVCTGGEKPCGVCPACIKAAGGNHPDIFEAGGEGASRSFHIDVVRQIRDNAYVLPNEASRRVMILTGAQAMTEQAQNALLKILEEPPSYILFILTCENRAQLLSTIQSRAVCLTLGAVRESEAAEAVGRLLPQTGEKEIREAVSLYGGIIGQAVQGLSDGTFQRAAALAPLFGKAIIAPGELDLLRLTGKLEKEKEAADGLLNALTRLFRDAIVRRFNAGESGPASETADLLARSLTREQLVALIKTTEELKLARLRNMNYTLFLTLLCSRMRTDAGR